MIISLFDIFKIGIGPSSSHTVGPMKAANEFLTLLEKKNLLNQVDQIEIDLFGSLALTGKGHGTDVATILGLSGERPDTILPEEINKTISAITLNKQIKLNKKHTIHFDAEKDIHFYGDQFLSFHSNAMMFRAFHQNQNIAEQTYYSIGGGFIVSGDELNQAPKLSSNVPFPFEIAEELMHHCRTNRLAIWQLMLANEKSWRDENAIFAGIDRIADIMSECIKRGCEQEGILPGGLKVRRRAKNLFEKATEQGKPEPGHPLAMQFLNCYAMAVNEENASFGRVVTAPTNGAAGIIPAVMQYYKEFCKGANQEGVRIYLLTAAAIAMLYKNRASISGAEVGCQGEVGVACSMAAGGLAAALGGTLEQIENAAEIGMEHNLGLPCDPPKGLVQIPCIERNAMGAVKAVNAAGLALAGDGQHLVSLDSVIATMNQIGRDMQTIYKETSLGGLAVNLPEC